ncbi:MAG: DUF2029 domain-containing protein [Proteobacteria bacterium]|nr:DUF2029 domain-containing protein [Pseudomonadota bacterium]
MTERLRNPALVPIAIVVGSLLAGAFYAGYAGDDVNWDWQNYHDYNVWALIHGRYAIDVMPAGLQTYFNPLVYFLAYGLRQFLPPLVGGLAMGAIHGLNLVAVYFLTRALLGSATGVVTAGAALLIAATGPMTLSEVGTSFSDILTAAPILAGVVLIVSAGENARARYLVAGLLIGAMVGLKLTNVVFAAGATVAVLFAMRPVVAIGYLAVGGVIGGLATGGFWSLMLWRDFGNPVFPLFNGFFQSPELPSSNLLDQQFLPRSVAEGLAYPIYWLRGLHRTSEFPFRDARFAVLLILLPAAYIVRVIKGSSIFTRRDMQFIAFFAISYLAWLTLFSIQRYAIVLELSCGPLIVLLLLRAITNVRSGDYLSVHAAGSALAIVAIGIALWSQPADWWRRPWSNPYRPVISARLRQPATYILLNKPTAYIAPLLPARSRFYQIGDIVTPIVSGGTFDKRIRAGLADPLPGGVWEIHDRNEVVQWEQLARFGLTTDPSKPCAEIESVNPASVIQVCPLKTAAR